MPSVAQRVAAFFRPVTEAAPLAPESVPQRIGFEYGVPITGTTAAASALNGDQRQQLLEQLYDVYMQCQPASACVDAVAKAVTAGGLVVVPDEDIPDGKTAVEPPDVQSLKRLLRFTNPRENMVQLMRSSITDLYVTGDAYVEVSFVADQPVAMYTLDAATMSVKADAHGTVLGYTQYLGPKQKAEFRPEQVIHLSLDAPRGGLYGTSPTNKLLLSITGWLFWSACSKDTGKRGNPPRIHTDLRKENSGDVEVWRQRYINTNLGSRNIGTPILTTNGGVVTELSQSKVLEFEETLRARRDEIVSGYGVPPSKVSIIESGNLGGGTGEAQDKTWRVNTIIPVQSLLLEAFNFQVVQQGFGITGWHLEFDEIDFRDSAVVEGIRVQRLIHGAYTPNRYRREIGEPEVDGGDDAIIMDRGKFVFLKDLAAYTQAEMNQMNAPLVAAGQAVAPLTGLAGPTGTEPGVGMVPTHPANQPGDPNHVDPQAKLDAATKVAQRPGGPDDATPGAAPKERDPDETHAALLESARRQYQHRRRQALKELPK